MRPLLGIFKPVVSFMKVDLPQPEGPTMAMNSPCLPEIATLHAPPEMVALGPAQRYTWLSRAVLLQPGTGGTVSSALYAEGLELSESPVPDPMVAMVTGKDAALHPLYLDVDRAFWRDLYALSGESGSTPPRVIASAIELRAMQDDYSPLELATCGLNRPGFRGGSHL